MSDQQSNSTKSARINKQQGWQEPRINKNDSSESLRELLSEFERMVRFREENKHQKTAKDYMSLESVLAAIEASYLPRKQVEAAIGPDNIVEDDDDIATYPVKARAHMRTENDISFGRNQLRQEIRSTLGLHTKEKGQI